MYSTNWQDRTQPPTDEQINALCSERIGFFMEDLRNRYGLYPVCGAELEFFVWNPDRTPGHFNISSEEVKSMLSDPTLFVKLYQENGGAALQGKYEIVLGTKRGVLMGQKNAPRSPAAIAREILQLKTILSDPSSKPSIAIPKITFSPTRGCDDTTAGLHANFSIFNDARHNLFFDKLKNDHSALAKRCAYDLLELQQDTLICYAPYKNSCDRFGKTRYTPQIFYAGDMSKEQDSIGLRPNTIDILSVNAELMGKDNYHIEDRLAGTDANPYLVFSGGLGILHRTITQNVTNEPASPKDFGFETTIDGMPQILYFPHFKMPNMPSIRIVANQATFMQDSIRTFRQSALAREIYGPPLHDAILAQAQARLQTGITR